MHQPPVVDLRLEGVAKRYRVEQSEVPSDSQGWASRLRTALFPPSTEFWALRNLSLDVPRGQTVGVIGHNGAGKSTLLKVLSGITAPTEGRIEINGRISALLEVGSGFHPELTGRENVFLSGSILGMRRREIRDKFEQIVDFAEVRKFIDVPVKRYSSGMMVRLAFSVAAHLDPDILLLDEVLAVGDATFQRKCINRVLELKKRKTTIVFISHDLNAIREISDRVVVMKAGQIVADADPEGAIAEYGRVARFRRTEDAQHGPREAEITCIQVFDPDGNVTYAPKTGSPFRLRVDYKAARRILNARIRVSVIGVEQQLICQLSTGAEAISLEEGPGAIEFYAPELVLAPGAYTVDGFIEESGQTLDWQTRSLALQVTSDFQTAGAAFWQPHKWRFVRESRWREPIVLTDLQSVR